MHHTILIYLPYDLTDVIFNNVLLIIVEISYIGPKTTNRIKIVESLNKYMRDLREIFYILMI